MLLARAALFVVFGVSGFAALLYQVVWQRSLYAIFGINTESVTVVVTAFMLGLGLGSLLGGRVSEKPSRPVLLIFSLVELGIGLFGLVSLSLFRAAGEALLHASPLMTAFATFLLVLVPTLLMGATLPLLVAYVVRETGSVGRSVGMLYFVNTLGSALASVAGVVLVLPNLGQARSVHVAVALNFVASLAVLGLHLWQQRRLSAALAATPAALVSFLSQSKRMGLSGELGLHHSQRMLSSVTTVAPA
jgi:predicted membrane-bound spermidine synthase